mmetsp:Transcript_39491/g.84171  ORF Transcript_39491/g.84171 Transcript_39491/m.84171 type:complete len:277 (-) Transcript_39491:147-977(-)
MKVETHVSRRFERHGSHANGCPIAVHSRRQHGAPGGLRLPYLRSGPHRWLLRSYTSASFTFGATARSLILHRGNLERWRPRDLLKRHTVSICATLLVHLCIVVAATARSVVIRRQEHIEDGSVVQRAKRMQVAMDRVELQCGCWSRHHRPLRWSTPKPPLPLPRPQPAEESRTGLARCFGQVVRGDVQRSEDELREDRHVRVVVQRDAAACWQDEDAHREARVTVHMLIANLSRRQVQRCIEREHAWCELLHRFSDEIDLACAGELIDVLHKRVAF